MQAMHSTARHGAPRATPSHAPSINLLPVICTTSSQGMLLHNLHANLSRETRPYNCAQLACARC